GAARCRAVSLSLVQRAGFALCYLGNVRPVPGRHCAKLCHYCARIFLAPRSGHARRARADGHVARHGPGRLVVGLYLRSHRVLPGGVPHGPGLESREHFDHALFVAAIARPRRLRLNADMISDQGVTRKMISPATVWGSPGTLAVIDKNQLPAIVRGAMKAYTPGSALASRTNAASISAPPSCAMTIRIWMIAASVTGLWSGLWSNRTAIVATLLDLISVLTGSNT